MKPNAVTNKKSRKPIAPLPLASALALALGIPVMVWGMMGDNMVLTEQNHTIWLTIGALTLAVMVLAGGTF